ncbi:GntR family transcriptional regulator [Acidovorax sp. MR-S7]|uniref:GntR family transcriptional regulator n=1 Tax=Acidovorax sp. MR-S7 TaxID=1268622 RepID=UPI00037B480A|nr:GntR family transcriptional regulator [Acidovorax sp. MR-S7]GAD21697.1 transcriptional regulator [Acidovorax sp. MR-S7]
MSASSTAIPASRRERDSNDEIYERIYIAIQEHRLLPGTKLPEERLAELFKVSRPRIREVLTRFAYEQIVELIPNKGAFVAKPTIEQAREIFEARRVIEPAIMRRLVQRATPDAVDTLLTHVEQEMDARARGDKRAVIRLSGEFHNVCADLAGNTTLARTQRELSTLTCLIILVYDAPPAESCRADEHSMIVEAVKAGDAERAAQLMLSHLDHIEKSINLEDEPEEVDLKEIFG